MAYNPVVTSNLSIPRGRLHTACQRAWRLNQALETLVPHRSVTREEVISRTRVTPAPPWHARAALLVMDLHAMTRKSESDLLVLVSGNAKNRGGSDRNTELSLEALPKLAEAVEDRHVWLVIFRLEQWIHKVEETLGLIEPLRHLPAPPGESEPRCPWCGYLTLRWQMRLARVRCVNPGCAVDPYHDRRPAGYLEMDLQTGVTEIVWDDDLPAQRRDLDDGS